MPTYEYVCKNCEYEFEQFQSMSAPHLTKCPKCGQETLQRKIGTGAGIIFVGGGFYCNDYKGKNASLPPASHHEHGDSCGCGHCGCNHGESNKSDNGK